MYFEEWELLTDPQLLQPLPQVSLNGISTLNDDARQNLITGMKAEVDKRIAKQAEIDARLDAES
jgi:hypothetical protein